MNTYYNDRTEILSTNMLNNCSSIKIFSKALISCNAYYFMYIMLLVKLL